MESIFLFLLVGILIYFTGYFSRQKTDRIRCALFLSAGLVSSTILGLIEPVRLVPGLTLPPAALSVAGLMAGLLLFWVEKRQFFTRPGIQFVATPLFGIVLAVTFYGLTAGLIAATHTHEKFAAYKRELFILYFLWGFIVVFGYAIPARWFKQNSERSRLS